MSLTAIRRNAVDVTNYVDVKNKVGQRGQETEMIIILFVNYH